MNKTALGATVWIMSVVQYAIAQLVVAAAWNPPYSWSKNYISDLGNTACGPFAVPHGSASYVCSPDHTLMNTSFVLAGILTIAGAFLLRPLWSTSRLARIAVLLWVLAGLGKIVVGLVPENANANLHLLGAFNIPLGSIAVLLLGLSLRRSQPALSAAGVILALTGLIGTILSSAGQAAGPGLYLGLGVGGMERVASYPGTVAMVLLALAALAAGARRGDHVVDEQTVSPGRAQLGGPAERA